MRIKHFQNAFSHELLREIRRKTKNWNNVFIYGIKIGAVNEGGYCVCVLLTDRFDFDMRLANICSVIGQYDKYGKFEGYRED